ncbi:MAG: hypothetical protein IJZ68_09310 [Bacteroidaceae bacterium]|nr:hypothetical protein [Bacteroidaceae bacterium]
MFNDTPGIEVVSFTPAFSKQKCPTILHLLLCAVTLAAVCFAPAYMNDVVNMLGTWFIWVWLAAFAVASVLCAVLAPMPSDDTYIVKVESSDMLAGFAEKFNIKKLKNDKTYRLTRKEATQ